MKIHDMPPKERTIIPPVGGWKSNCVYKVLVAHNRNNPIHEAILHAGFIEKDGTLGAYSEVWQNSYDRASEIGEIHYLGNALELCTIK